MPFPAVALGISALAVPMVVKVLVALGVSVVSYTGASALLSTAEATVFASTGSLHATLYQLLALMGVFTGIKILFSAYAAKVSIQLAMGAFTKFKVSGS